MNEHHLQEFLGGALKKFGMSNSGSYNPIYNIRPSGRYAFVEMRSISDCANFLNLDGIPYMNSKLKICRPIKFQGSSPTVSYYQFNTLYELWLEGSLKLLTAGTESTVLVIMDIASAKELSDMNKYNMIVNDVKAECSAFGKVLNVIAKPGRNANAINHSNSIGSINLDATFYNVFVELSTIDEAKKVLYRMKGRAYDNRYVDIRFYPLHLFKSNTFDQAPECPIITQSDGPLPLEKVFTPQAFSSIRQ